MIKFKLIVAAAGTTIAMGITGPAFAELTPWEKFCLNTAKPKDLGRCLDGLPSGGGRNNILVAPGGGTHPAATVKTQKKLVAPRTLRSR
jgi:hypothetical protein